MARPILRWAVPVVLVCAGCGGEGGGGDQPTSKTLDVYLTGSAAKAYSHVWATLDRVVLTNGLTQAPIFEETGQNGLKIDLTTLKDKGGPLYLYLGSKEYQTGLFSNAEITLENQVTLEPADHSASRTVKFSATKDTTTTVRIDLSKASKSVPGANLVLNLDSAAWKDKAGAITLPKDKLVNLSEGAGLMDPSRHLKQTLSGTVANLDTSGPEKAFSLNRPAGEIAVREKFADTKTSTTSAPQIFDGMTVVVTGSYDPASGVFNASSVDKAAPKSLPKPASPVQKPVQASSKP